MMRLYSTVIGILVLWPIFPVCGSKYSPDNYIGNNYDVVDPGTGLIAIPPAREEKAVTHVVEEVSPAVLMAANVDPVKPIRAWVVDPSKIGIDLFTTLPDDVLRYILKQKGVPKLAHPVCFRFRNLITQGLGVNEKGMKNVYFKLPYDLTQSINLHVVNGRFTLNYRVNRLLNALYWYYHDGKFTVPSSTRVVETLERQIDRIRSIVTYVMLEDDRALFSLKLFGKLNHLVVRNNWFSPFKDFMCLSQSIKQLEITATSLTDFKPLLPFQNIQKLSLGIKGRCDFSLLPSFTNIQYLSLENTAFLDCAVLAQMTALKSLSLNFSVLKQHQFADIAKMDHLRGLFLRKTGIDEINFLKGLTNLESLDLSWNQDLRQVRPLGFLVSLKQLSICHTKINSLSALKDLEHLETLDMVGLLVSDLYSLTRLSAIHLWDNYKSVYARCRSAVSITLPTVKEDEQLLNQQREALLSLSLINRSVVHVDEPTLKDHMSTADEVTEPPA